MTEQHTLTPHPFAKELKQWLDDTSKPLWYILNGDSHWHIVKDSPACSARVLSADYVHAIHVGENPPPKEGVYFDRKHYTINAPIKDIKEAEGNPLFIVDLHQSTGVLTLEDSDIHFLEECFKRGFVYLNHEDALMKAKHLMDKIGLGLAM